MICGKVATSQTAVDGCRKRTPFYKACDQRGLQRAGIPGPLAAWVGFTMPSALLMVGFAYSLGVLGSVEQASWIAGLIRRQGPTAIAFSHLRR